MHRRAPGLGASLERVKPLSTSAFRGAGVGAGVGGGVVPRSLYRTYLLLLSMGCSAEPVIHTASPWPHPAPWPHHTMVELRAPERIEVAILSTRFRVGPFISVQPSHTMSVGTSRPPAPCAMKSAPLLAVAQSTVTFFSVTRSPPIAWIPSWCTAPTRP